MQSDAVCAEADVTARVVALGTGQSRDVHGSLVVHAVAGWGGEPPAPAAAHFKVLDGGVKVFPVGAGRV